MTREEWKLRWRYWRQKCGERIQFLIPQQIFHLWVEGKRVGMKHLPPGHHSFRVLKCRELNSKDGVPQLLLDVEIAE